LTRNSCRCHSITSNDWLWWYLLFIYTMIVL